MLRVGDSFSGTDTGRQRRHNEDSLFARSPLFVVADGMGGAQAGEVASRTAVEFFQGGIGEDDRGLEERLAEPVIQANARIHELSQSNPDQAGMGTTLTAVYAGPEDVVIAHVGDSRAYLLRDGQLSRLTNDHSLVDELLRQGKLTPQEAEEHPQRSIITRALGPEPVVEVDTGTHRARAGDVYLLNSDGLTSMVHESKVQEILRAYPRLRDAGNALLAAANEAGGRDNITVILFRLDDVDGTSGAEGDAAAEQPTVVGRAWSGDDDAPSPTPDDDEGASATADHGDAGTGADAPGESGGATLAAGRSPALALAEAEPPRALAPRRVPRPPRAPQAAASPRPAPRRRRRWLVRSLAALSVFAILLCGLYFATTAVYFVGTNNRGFVTVFSGLPYELPGSVKLYSQYYVSGVPAASVPVARRRTLLDHALRSQADASNLVRALELGQIAGAS